MICLGDGCFAVEARAGPLHFIKRAFDVTRLEFNSAAAVQDERVFKSRWRASSALYSTQ